MNGSTIFARASGGGRAGVAVYRISGPLAGEALRRLTGSRGEARFARRALVRDLDGSVIDDGLALWFPGPKSFTGEDVAELHLHGSPAVEVRLNRTLTECGLDPAGPGAFTWRAFINGKIDLTQAEGLAELLEAETELQHRQAMGRYRGALRERAEGWRQELVRAMAHLDAAVDFPDEEDVPDAIAAGALPHVLKVRDGLASLVAESGRAGKVAEGISVALVGPPNAGKSTLFNALLQEERAIVSAEAGTTRDIVSAVLEIGGHRVTLMDMAGLREDAASAIETEGVRRAKDAADRADHRLVCWPAGAGSLPGWLSELSRPGDLLLRTKADLAVGDVGEGFAMSAEEPEALSGLLSALTNHLDRIAAPGLAAGERQVHLLGKALSHLEAFETAASAGPETGAEVLRSTATAFEELTGRIAPDEVLGDIFSAFCIGK